MGTRTRNAHRIDAGPGINKAWGGISMAAPPCKAPPCAEWASSPYWCYQGGSSATWGLLRGWHGRTYFQSNLLPVVHSGKGVTLEVMPGVYSGGKSPRGISVGAPLQTSSDL